MCGKIGVFDSGVGGLTVLRELVNLLPSENYIYLADSKNAPYGSKSIQFIVSRVREIAQFFIERDVKIIVVACNSATAAAIDILRNEFDIPIVGMEPAIKPASLLSKSGKIGVFATEATKHGKLYNQKLSVYGEYLKIFYTDAYKLVQFAENNEFESLQVSDFLNEIINPLVLKGVDQLVLGCTHYPLFLNQMIEILKGHNVNIINPAEAIARRVKDVLICEKILLDNKDEGVIEFYSSGDLKIMKNILKRLNFQNKNISFNYSSI